MIKKLFLATLLLSFFTYSSFALESESNFEVVKTKIEEKFSIKFNDSNIAIIKKANLEEKFTLVGYSKIEDTSELGLVKAKDAAIIDFRRNYLLFTKGINFELEKDSLKLSDSYTLKSSDLLYQVEEKKLFEDTIYSVSKQIELTKNQKKELEKLATIVALSEYKRDSEEKLLDIYKKIHLQTIKKALLSYYGELKDKKTGKIIIKNILYNSLQETTGNSENFIYALEFYIKEK